MMSAEHLEFCLRRRAHWEEAARTARHLAAAFPQCHSEHAHMLSLAQRAEAYKADYDLEIFRCLRGGVFSQKMT